MLLHYLELKNENDDNLSQSFFKNFAKNNVKIIEEKRNYLIIFSTKMFNENDIDKYNNLFPNIKFDKMELKEPLISILGNKLGILWIESIERIDFQEIALLLNHFKQLLLLGEICSSFFHPQIMYKQTRKEKIGYILYPFLINYINSN